MNGGAEIVSRADLDHAPGAVLAGKYTLLHPLGAEGEGLWLARCGDDDPTNSKAIVALQLVAPPPHRVGAAEAFDAQLNKVARLSAAHLLPPLDHGSDETGLLYVAYEWVKGRTLAQALREDWPLADDAIFSISLQLLAALEHVHEAGLAHGDLQPSKIALRAVPVPAQSDERRGTQLVLRGLGLAEFTPYRFEQPPPEHLSDVTSEWIIGRPEYAAPEQLQGELPSARSDVYAAGVLLFQLLTRSVPFEAASAYEVAFMQRFAPPEPPSAYALVNPALEAICLRALSKTPELRFQSARDMRNALLEAQAKPVHPLAPARSSTALALERALAPVMRASSAALAKGMRASSAALAPVFRADLLSGAPIEAPARVRRSTRALSPMLVAAALGVVALTAAPWWLRSDDAEAVGSEPMSSSSPVGDAVDARLEGVRSIPRSAASAPASDARLEGVRSIPRSAASASDAPSTRPQAEPSTAPELAASFPSAADAEQQPALSSSAEKPHQLRIATAIAPGIDPRVEAAAAVERADRAEQHMHMNSLASNAAAPRAHLEAEHVMAAHAATLPLAQTQSTAAQDLARAAALLGPLTKTESTAAQDQARAAALQGALAKTESTAAQGLARATALQGPLTKTESTTAQDQARATALLGPLAKTDVVAAQDRAWAAAPPGALAKTEGAAAQGGAAAVPEQIKPGAEHAVVAPRAVRTAPPAAAAGPGGAQSGRGPAAPSAAGAARAVQPGPARSMAHDAQAGSARAASPELGTARSLAAAGEAAAVAGAALSSGARTQPTASPGTFTALAVPDPSAALAAKLAHAAAHAPQPPAANPVGLFSVDLGEPVTSRRSVSRGALRSALNPMALARCYRDTLGPAAAPSSVNATLELSTDLSGRVRKARLRGAKLRPALVECVESHARRSRVREGDSGGAMQATVPLTFHAD